MMEVWSAYNCRDSASYSSATHVQIGPFQASKRDVSVKASDQSASAESQEQEVCDGHVLMELLGRGLARSCTCTCPDHELYFYYYTCRF